MSIADVKISRILFADDDADDHYIFSKVIREQFPGIQLIIRNTCKDLIRHLDNKEIPLPDIIFLDLNVFGNERFQCLKELKKHEYFNFVPVVIYSTSNVAEHISEA